MTIESFLLKDKLNLIESSFTDEGWLTIYESAKSGIEDQSLVYCCLVDSKRIITYRKDNDWVIQYGSEGKPTIWGDGGYQTNADEGIEPFLFAKSFNYSDGHESYIDITEEFVLYFKLYERAENKQYRNYYFIDELGEMIEVIKVEPSKIKIRLKYLKEYISIRKIYFSICFDFMRLSKQSLEEMKINIQEKEHSGENYFYNYSIRHLDFIEPWRSQSFIHGKIIINPDETMNKGYLFDYENQEYAAFITGFDKEGNEILQNCKKEKGKDFTLTYFKREVLDKYYNEPNKYEVDGWHVKSKFFILNIDNNVESYIPVFLDELSMLPYKEQLHWKQYNISPRKGISHSYYKTMIEGEWVNHPETVDLFFKYKYEHINKKWEHQYGWKLFRPLSEEDYHIFTSLHLPSSNNVKSFCEQMLSITKIMIDRLNEEEISKHITLEPNDRGISKLNKFIMSKRSELPELILFLRQLWNLRSGLLSHSFSNANKSCLSAIEYFGLTKTNYVETAKTIFVKSIHTLNSFEKIFLNSEMESKDE